MSSHSASLIQALTHANLLLHAVAYASMGVTGFLSPAKKLSDIGLAVETPAGLTTFRVIYGGLMVAIALIFLMSSVVRGMERFGLLAMIAVMASLIVSRSVGAVLDHSRDTSQLLWSGIELAVLLLSIYLYRAQASIN